MTRALVLAALAAAAATGQPAAAESASRWTLQSLGYGDLVFGPSVRESQAREVVFELPAGARQGKGAWYLVRLHYRLELAPRSRAGRVYVLASTNGKACAQIRYTTKRDAKGLLVEENELGLVRGARTETSRSLVHELTFRNFLLFGGVRGGRNVLTIEVQQHEGARVEALRVYADSAVERSQYGPATLRLEPVLESRTVEAGERFTLGFRLRNPSRRPAAPGTVRVDVGPGLGVDGSAIARFARVPPGVDEEGLFTLAAEAEGVHEARLEAESISGSPVARVRVEVLARDDGPVRRVSGGVAAGALVLAAVLLWARRRRKMSRPAH